MHREPVAGLWCKSTMVIAILTVATTHGWAQNNRSITLDCSDRNPASMWCNDENGSALAESVRREFASKCPAAEVWRNPSPRPDPETTACILSCMADQYDGGTHSAVKLDVRDALCMLHFLLNERGVEELADVQASFERFSAKGLKSYLRGFAKRVRSSRARGPLAQHRDAVHDVVECLMDQLREADDYVMRAAFGDAQGAIKQLEEQIRQDLSPGREVGADWDMDSGDFFVFRITSLSLVEGAYEHVASPIASLFQLSPEFKQHEWTPTMTVRARDWARKHATSWSVGQEITFYVPVGGWTVVGLTPGSADRYTVRGQSRDPNVVHGFSLPGHANLAVNVTLEGAAKNSDFPDFRTTNDRRPLPQPRKTTNVVLQYDIHYVGEAKAIELAQGQAWSYFVKCRAPVERVEFIESDNVQHGDYLLVVVDKYALGTAVLVPTASIDVRR